MIGFKKSIDDIALEVSNSAYIEASMKFQNLQHNGSSIMIHGNVLLSQDALCRVIASAVSVGIEEALNNIYTNDDFEKDLGLR